MPLNWHWVADEVAYVLGRRGCLSVVVDQRFGDVVRAAMVAAEAPEVGVALLVGSGPSGPDDVFEPYGSVAGSPPPDELDDLSRGGPMFYTSGTTGHPKGVRGSLAQLGGSPEIWTLMAHSMRTVTKLPDRDAVQGICGPMYHSAQWVMSMFSRCCAGPPWCSSTASTPMSC